MAVFTPNGRAGIREGETFVTGRVVDVLGQPVPNAVIWVTSGNCPEDFAFSLVARADDNGSFRFEVDAEQATDMRTLWITGPLPPGSFDPIELPALNRVLPPDRQFVATIRIRPGQTVDVGTLVTSVFYWQLKVVVTDRSGRPLLTNLDQWSSVMIRVRTPGGQEVALMGPSHADIKESVDFGESCIVLALPTGDWVVELSLHDDKGPWLRSGRVETFDGPEKSTIEFRRRE
jgi:hypothetical protein